MLNMTIEESLRLMAKRLIQETNSTYGVLWQYNSKNYLQPYYWYGDFDCRNLKYEGTIEELLASKLSDLFKLEISDSLNIKFKNDKEILAILQLGKINGHYENKKAEVFFENDYHNILDVQEEYFPENKIIECRKLCKDYVSNNFVTEVLKDLNLNIYEGEFLLLLGPSGSGKTTLLNLLGGLDLASSGDVFYRDLNLSCCDENKLCKYRKDNVGFIFQNYNLMPNLTVKQNLELIGELVKEPLKSREVLQIVDLKDKENNYPSQLSGGQQQRVSIARALIKNPDIIIADEPTAALDYHTSLDVLTALENIHHQHKTLIMVTHNEEITKMADRVIKLKDGKLLETYLNKKPLHGKDLVW